MTWPRGFDLRGLEVFLAVAETGSMVEAGKRLGLTPSAVSQHVSVVEKSLATSLFDRTLRPIRATPAGIMLRQRAEQILALAKQTRNAVATAGDSALPLLRLAVINSLSVPLVPDLVDKARSVIPTGNISVWSGLSLDHVPAFTQRELDILVATETLEDVGGLERYLLFTEPYVLLMPAESSMHDLSLRDLASRHPFVRYSYHNQTGRQIEQHLRRLRLSIPRHAEFDLTRLVADEVLRRQAWAITTPICLLDRCLNDSRLLVRPLPGPGFRRYISLIARSGELGDLPGKLADLCIELFRAKCLPDLLECWPWLKDEIEFGHETAPSRSSQNPDAVYQQS